MYIYIYTYIYIYIYTILIHISNVGAPVRAEPGVQPRERVAAGRAGGRRLFQMFASISSKVCFQFK